MKLLVVEDDKFKQEAISSAVGRSIPKCELQTCKSVQSAVRLITDEEFEVIILDMSLPSHDLEQASGLGIPRLSGGVEVLFELQYQGKSPKVIIVTQYPEIEVANRMIPLDEILEFMAVEYEIGISLCLFFDFESDHWVSPLVSGIVD